jgi:hypothetical protein
MIGGVKEFSEATKVVFLLLIEYTRFTKTHPLLCSLLWMGVMSLFTNSSAYAWGTKGHEIVAGIAETHLTGRHSRTYQTSPARYYVVRRIDMGRTRLVAR